MSARRGRGLPWQRNTGNWATAGWYAAAILGAGIALVTSVPLAARIALARAADGFVPGALTVERVVWPRRGGAGRYAAHGRLADGSEGRVTLNGTAALAGPKGRPARLPVMVNDELTGTWLHRQRVQPQDPALRERMLRDAAKLLAIAACSLALSVLAWRRLRRLR